MPYTFRVCCFVGFRWWLFSLQRYMLVKCAPACGSPCPQRGGGRGGNSGNGGGDTGNGWNSNNGGNGGKGGKGGKGGGGGGSGSGGGDGGMPLLGTLRGTDLCQPDEWGGSMGVTGQGSNEEGAPPTHWANVRADCLYGLAKVNGGTGVRNETKPESESTDEGCLCFSPIVERLQKVSKSLPRSCAAYSSVQSPRARAENSSAKL
jgi:hypothetical protein